MKNLIEECLLQHISEENAIFVFPTQIAAEMWSDRIIEISPVKAVAMERFIAWDDFKGASIRSSQKDKSSVPGTMRKIFSEVLLEENKKTPFLKSIILPQFVKYSKSFSSYISSILPSLKLWKTYFEKSNREADEEDEDLMEIFTRYKKFLDDNMLFDPAWEEPPFIPDSNHYYVFFPEILSDYTEYKKILEGSKNDITIISFDNLSSEENQVLTNQKVNFFRDSRSEIKYLCLYLRKLHADGVKWNEIAVSVPDIDSYGPYLERDFKLYNIPYLSRNAKALSLNRAGQFFSEIENCISNNFAFNDVKSLLLNSNIPWKNQDLIQEFIKFGQENNCICSYNYKNKFHDVWLESFKNSKVTDPGQSLLISRLKDFYTNLKRSLEKFTKAESFDEIRKIYFKFRSTFLDEDNFLPEADLIISREISELGTLTDLEKNFPQYKVPSPFSFFISYLDGVSYLAQTKIEGVRILSYKTAATAPFKCHIIVDSSQASLSVIYSKLGFLREDKRKKLKLTDENVSDNFIKLYSMNSQLPVYFSVSAKNFTGYSQTYSSLEEVDHSNSDSENYKNEKNFPDILRQEKDFISEGSNSLLPEKLFDWQKESFERWKNNSFTKKEKDFDSTNLLHQIMLESDQYKEIPETNIKILKASKTSLSQYFDCPREYLFNYALNLEEENNEANLIDQFAVGNLYHSIFENYMNILKENNLPIFANEFDLGEKYEEFHKQALEEAIDNSNLSYLAKEQLRAMKEAIHSISSNSLTHFSNIFFGLKVYGTEIGLRKIDKENNLLINGRADLILRHQQSNQLYLIDYKIKSMPDNLYASNEEGADPLTECIDLQMPLYLYVLEDLHDENSEDNSYKKTKGKKIENVCFYSILDCKVKALYGEELAERIRIKDKLFNRNDFDKSMEVFHKQLNNFSELVHNDNFSINPEIQTYEKCSGCDYKSICRRSFTVAKE